MIALRNLGAFHAQRGPFQDMEKARRNFQAAVDQIQGEPRDDATAYTLGFTWERWGTAEYMNNFPDEAQRKIGSAKKYYSDMSAMNSVRNWALVFLEERMRNVSAAGTASPPPLPTFSATPAASVPSFAPMQSPGVSP